MTAVEGRRAVNLRQKNMHIWFLQYTKFKKYCKFCIPRRRTQAWPRLSLLSNCLTFCGTYKYDCYDMSKCWTALRTHLLYRISAKSDKW